MLSQLDKASRHCVYRLWLHLGCYTACAAFSWFLFTRRSFADFSQVVQLTYMFGGLAAFALARRFGDKVNGASFNHWDEGAMLYGISLGVHILERGPI